MWILGLEGLKWGVEATTTATATRTSKSTTNYRFNTQNNNSARASHFEYISFSSLHEYEVKFPNFTFSGGSKHEPNKTDLNVHQRKESDTGTHLNPCLK